MSAPWAQWLAWDWTEQPPAIRPWLPPVTPLTGVIQGARGEPLTGAGAGEYIEEPRPRDVLRDTSGDTIRDTAGDAIRPA